MQMNSLPKTIVLVGLMGAGKTTVGRLLAKKLGLAFKDSDHEIEQAARMKVADIFEKYGESDFRAGEKKVIARLLADPPHVLATGGGAFMDPDTRAVIKAHGLSVWLKADIDALFERIKHDRQRPLLKHTDPKARLLELMETRYPIYAESDITIDSSIRNPEKVVMRILKSLEIDHDEET